MSDKPDIDLGVIDITATVIEDAVKKNNEYINIIIGEVSKIYLDVFQNTKPERPESYIWLLPVPVLECIRRNKDAFDDKLKREGELPLMGVPVLVSPRFSQIRCVLKCCFTCIFCVDLKKGQHCGKRKLLAPIPCMVQINGGGECFPPFKNWSPKQDLF